MMKKACAVLMALLLSMGILLSILYVECVSAGLMAKRFMAFSNVPLTQSQAENTAREITDYLRSKTDALPMFQAHEVRHMQDVQALVALLEKVLTGMWVLLIILAAFNRKKPLYGIMWKTLSAVLGAICLVIVYGLLDFEGLFVAFHKIAFTNDLWLLNPYTDLLLQLMPTGFFMAYALSIGLIWLFIMIVAIVLFRRAERGNGAIFRRKPQKA